jgi:hypothetical protein
LIAPINFVLQRRAIHRIPRPFLQKLRYWACLEKTDTEVVSF